MMRSIAPRARTTCAAARRALATFDDPRALYKDYEQEPAVVADHDHARTGLSRVPYHLRRGLILPNHVSGMDVLHTPLCVACPSLASPTTPHPSHRYNKGSAFAPGERDRLGLRGLLPPRVMTMEEHCSRAMATLRSMASDIDKHTYLRDLLDRNETLFHRVLVRHVAELAPIIYTPTVGRACVEFGHQFKRARGMCVCRRPIPLQPTPPRLTLPSTGTFPSTTRATCRR